MGIVALTGDSGMLAGLVAANSNEIAVDEVSAAGLGSEVKIFKAVGMLIVLAAESEIDELLKDVSAAETARGASVAATVGRASPTMEVLGTKGIAKLNGALFAASKRLVVEIELSR